MNAAAKIAVYTLALAGAFGAASAVGAAVGPISTTSATHTAHDGAAHPAEASAAIAASPTPTDVVDGYEVTRTAGAALSGAWTFNFAVTRDGAPVQTDPYLGEPGHLVIIRESDFAYLHVHPQAGAGTSVSFAATLPSAGTYRLFFDFSAGGATHTAAFVFDATGSAIAAPAAGNGAGPTTTDGHAGH